MTRWLLPRIEAEKIRQIDEAVAASASNFFGLKVTSEATPMSMSYGIATVRVDGVLVKSRDPILDLFGVKQTAYSEIVSQVKKAESRGAKKGTIVFNSPGGEVVTDLVDAMDAVAKSPIEWKAVAEDMIASAAYSIGSQAKGGIYATSDMTLIGSIGVAMDVFVSSYRKSITNTASPDKRPDATTEEGVSAIQRELDDIYGVLAKRIAKGRGVSLDTVNNEYGRGAVMTARTAIDMKIIDGMDTSVKRKTAAGAQADGGKMDIETLKKEHPAVYEAAKKDGFAEGVAAEHARVVEHCDLGKRYGTSDIAIEAISTPGKKADIAVLASHQDESAKRKMVADRGKENAGDTGAGKSATTTTGKTETSKEDVEAGFNKTFGADGWTMKIGA